MMTMILLYFGCYAINKTVEDKSGQTKKKVILIGGFTLWHLYTYLIASNKLLYNFDFPPRFALLLILPLFLFTGIFIYKSRNKAWIKVIPTTWLTFYQSFRILVESLFVLTVAAGILHKEVSVEGYNYDLFFGISALLIGSLFVTKKLSLRLLKLWNYLGLAVISVIIILFMTTIYTPQLFGFTSTPAPLAFTLYPYVLVAGYLMPSAVFIHTLAITQINKLR